MTEKELNSIFYIDKQIARLKQRIAELQEEAIGCGGLGRLPKGNIPGNPTERIAIKKIQLVEELNKAIEKRIDAESTIRKFIETIPDPAIKTIAELRFIYQFGWDDIAAEVSPRHKDYDRTTVSKKLRRFLKKFC